MRSKVRLPGMGAGGDPFRSANRGEEGFLLLGAIVAVFLVLLILSVAAPTVAKQLRREREVESAHRADQYVRAIRLYYKKFGHYPGNMEQMEKSNNIRFLRQRYPDPLTGKADWRLIHVGEQKTTVKGFFGQPLAGIASSGLGSLSSSASSAGNGSPMGSSTSAFGSPGMSGPSGSSGLSGSSGSIGSSSGGPTSGTGPGGGLGLGSAGPSTTSPSSSFGSSSGGLSSQSGTSFTGSGAPFLGIGSAATGDSIVVVNEQTTYPTWEFIYDPRIEQMKAKSNLLGGGMASGGSSGLGSLSPSSAGASPASGPGTAVPTPSTPGQNATPQ